MAGYSPNANQGERDPLPALPASGRENDPLSERGREKNAFDAMGRATSPWRLLIIGALAVTLAGCGSSQLAGTVTYQVISDTGPLAHGDAIFAATSLGGVEAEVAASPLNQTLEGYQWKVRMIPPKSAYVALIIGPQSKGAAGAFACVDTTLTSAAVSGSILTFVETPRVVGPSAPCRTARPESHYSLVAVPLDGLGSGKIRVVVTHQADGAGAMTMALPADSETNLQLS